MENPGKRGWSDERRATHAAAIRRWAPWTRSTGPRTSTGKARSSRNAWKHGKRSVETQLLRAILVNQKRLHAAAARYARHKSATNELLNDAGIRMLSGAVRDGLWLIDTVLAPAIMQKPCILGPPAGKS